MSRASRFITLAADLAADTIKDGVRNVTKLAADGVSNITTHLFPHSYDDSDNRGQFNKWASFATLLIGTLGSELMFFKKLEENSTKIVFDNFVRGHVVPAVGSLVPAVTTTLMLYSIGNPDTLDIDKTVLAGASLLLVNLTVIDFSILRRAISNVRNPQVAPVSLNNDDLDSAVFSTSDFKPDTRREKIALVLIPLGWALAIGAGIAANFAARDQARALNIVASTTGVSAFKDLLVFPITGRRPKGTEAVPLLGGGYKAIEETKGGTGASYNYSS